MAKLIIYLGDALDRELDLGQTTSRIGRGDDNDIVLGDTTAGVSRVHAELRFEHGRYSIVDSNSRNGVWVAGNRVQMSVLEPGVPVVLGAYKLVLQEPQPVAFDPDQATVVMRAADDATVVMQAPVMLPPKNVAAKPAAPAPPTEPKAPPKAAAPAAPPTAKAELPKVDAPKPAAAAPPEPAPKPAPPPVAAAPKPAPPPVAPPKPAPAPPAPAVATTKTPVTAKKPAGTGTRKSVVYGAVAASVLLIAGGIAFFMMSLPGSDSEPVAQSAEAIAPASQEPPAAPAPTATAPPPPAATSSVPAPPRPTQAAPPPRRSPEPTQATAPAPRPAPRPPASQAAPRPQPTPPQPATRGRGARGQETTTGRGAPPPRPPDPTTMFENARSAVIKGDYVTAVNLLEEVLKLQPTNQAAENLLGVARGGAKNASQLAVDAGNKAELTGDFLAARTQYELAQRLDPQSATAADAMRRLRGRMQTEGEEVFRRAQQFHTAGRDADAITNYEKALELLPPDHVQAKLARERVAELKSGASPR